MKTVYQPFDFILGLPRNHCQCDDFNLCIEPADRSLPDGNWSGE